MPSSEEHLANQRRWQIELTDQSNNGVFKNLYLQHLSIHVSNWILHLKPEEANLKMSTFPWWLDSISECIPVFHKDTSEDPEVKYHRKRKTGIHSQVLTQTLEKIWLSKPELRDSYGDIDNGDSNHYFRWMQSARSFASLTLFKPCSTS